MLNGETAEYTVTRDGTKPFYSFIDGILDKKKVKHPLQDNR